MVRKMWLNIRRRAVNEKGEVYYTPSWTDFKKDYIKENTKQN